MIALHAALLARKTGPAGAHDLRPPRGHRGDDQAPPGGDPPPHRRATRRHARGPGHRPGDGRRRLRDAHAGRAVARRRSTPAARTTCANVRIRVARRRDQHAAERRVPRLRRAADRVRRRDAGRAAPPTRSASRRSSSARRNVYRPGGVTPTGQVLRDDVAGDEVLEPGRRGERVRAASRAKTAAERDARAGRRARPRAASASRCLARRRLHRLGRGEDGHGRRRRADGATGRIRILTASTDIGQGTKTIFPQLVAGGARASTSTTSRWRRRTRRSCPTPARRSRRARRWSSAAW